jgi:hypothetical protein
LPRTVIVWGGLSLASVLSYWIGESAGSGRVAATAAVLGIAFAKARYIGLDFMELRHAPRAMRIAFEAWAIAACLGLIALFSS